jgi:hypothetical protein
MERHAKQIELYMEYNLLEVTFHRKQPLCPNSENFTLLANVFTLFLVFTLWSTFQYFTAFSHAPLTITTHSNSYLIYFTFFCQFRSLASTSHHLHITHHLIQLQRGEFTCFGFKITHTCFELVWDPLSHILL